MIDICQWNLPMTPMIPRKEGVWEAPIWKCYCTTGLVNISHLSTNDWGPVVWDCRGTPKNPNRFHRGIPEIQTTGPQTNNEPLAEPGEKENSLLKSVLVGDMLVLRRVDSWEDSLKSPLTGIFHGGWSTLRGSHLVSRWDQSSRLWW